MEYQKKLICQTTTNQPSKFRRKSWVEIIDKAQGTYKTTSQIKLKTTMLKSMLFNYSDAYTLFKGTIYKIMTKKKAIYRNCAPFTDCIRKINNTQVDYSKDIDVVMLMHNLTEYSHSYSNISGSVWKFMKILQG